MALKKPDILEALFEPERGEGIHLDQDRQGVSGSPPLVETILKKIDATSVFVADVSPVAEIEQKGEDGKSRIKKVMNPNVAIELGYATKSIGDTSILMVMNRQYGGRNDLPFDLAHKAGPIFFDLPDGADGAQIKAEQKILAGKLKEALSSFVAAQESSTPPPKFPAQEPHHATMHWFQSGEELAWVGEERDGDRIGYKFPTERYFYLRIIPHTPSVEKFRLADLRKLSDDVRLRVFDDVNDWFVRQNKFGVILIDPKNPNSDQLTSCTQIFRTGEIWALNRSLFVDFEGRLTIPVKRMSDILTSSLTHYLRFLTDKLDFSPPFDVEFGARGLQDCGIGIRDVAPKWVEIYDHKFSKRLTLYGVDEGVIIAARKVMIDELFGATAYDAPVPI